MRLLSLFLIIFLHLNCQKYGQKPSPALSPDVVARIEGSKIILLKSQAELTRRTLALLEKPVVMERHEVRYSAESQRYYLHSVGYDADDERHKTFGFILKNEVGDLLVFDAAYSDCIHFCEAVEPCSECELIIYEPCARSSAQCGITGGSANVGVILKNVEH